MSQRHLSWYIIIVYCCCWSLIWIENDEKPSTSTRLFVGFATATTTAARQRTRKEMIKAKEIKRQTSQETRTEESNTNHSLSSMQQQLQQQKLQQHTRQGQETEEQEQQRPLIVGGDDAPIGRYPYIVSLVDRNHDAQCSATLISPTIVLTAAHCQIGILEYAVIGRYDLSNRFETIDTIPILSEFIHPLHSPLTIRYDVMVLKLQHPPAITVTTTTTTTAAVNTANDTAINKNNRNENGISASSSSPSSSSFSNTATTTTVSANWKFVRLHYRTNENETDDTIFLTHQQQGGLLTTIGWGSTNPVETVLPSKLQVITSLDFVPNDICRQSEDKKISYENSIYDDMFCTFDPINNRDACFGDSGGPITIPNHFPNDENDNSNYFTSTDLQVGIISWGEECASDVFPGVNARVSYAFDWIRRWVCALEDADANNEYYLSSNSNSNNINNGDGDDVAQQQLLQLLPSVPAYFGCNIYGDMNTYSPQPTRVPSPPTTSPAPTIYTIPVTIQIVLDECADETSFELYDITASIVLLEYNIGDLQWQDEFEIVLYLLPNHRFLFTIEDSAGNGIDDGGFYQIFLGTSPTTTTTTTTTSGSATSTISTVIADEDIRLVLGVGRFGSSATHEFETPDEWTPPTFPSDLPTFEPSQFPSSSCRQNTESCVYTDDCCPRLLCRYAQCRPDPAYSKRANKNSLAGSNMGGAGGRAKGNFVP